MISFLFLHLNIETFKLTITMKLLKHFITVTTIYVLFSCSTNERRISIIEQFPTITEISPLEVPVDSFLGKPYQIVNAGDKLIIADIIDEKLIHIYDLKEQKTVKQLFSKGSGPNDLLLPLYINTVDTSTINIFQRQNSVYTEYHISNLLQGDLNPITKVTCNNSDDIKKISNDKFIGNGFFKEGALGVFNNEGVLIKEWNTYPDFIYKLPNPSSKFLLGQQYFEFNPQTHLLMTASIFTGDIQVFNVNDQLEITKIKEYKTPISSIERRIDNSNEIKPNANDIVYYEDIACTEHFFYILYCGNPMGKKETTENNYILQFDSTGTPIQAIKTNKRIFKFCVSHNDSTIYAIALTEDLSHNIIKFDLSSKN